MAVTDLYNAEFMDHVSHPDYKYELEDADCTHEGVNPSCGDLMVGRTPQEARELCALFMAMVRGEKDDDATMDALEDAALLRDIAHMPARVKCAELAWRTLDEMLADREGGKAGDGAEA